MWRAVPPVYSPISIGALPAALVSRGAAAREEVERRIRAELGPRDLVLTDTGTSALRLALEVCARERPGPVALPAYGCYDLLSAVHGAGVEIAFYDVTPETLGPDFSSLERALREGAGTVVIAHLFGIPVDMGEVRALASAHGALVVEDAAQGIGGALGDRPLGSLGDLSVLSFARGKGRTGGSGGALLSYFPEPPPWWQPVENLHSGGGRARSLVAMAAAWTLTRPSAYRIPLSIPGLGLGETHYREPRDPGGMPSHAATVLSASWALASRESGHRRTVAARYSDWLAARPDAHVTAIRAPEGATPGYLRFPVLCADADVPGAAVRLGIVRGYPRPLPTVGTGRSASRRDTDTRGAGILASRLVTLPTHSRLAERDVRQVRAWLERAK
ncbi:MAG: DegT/DnrJ/EryC1/StrS family aminotransferase [Gemmatimonadota bacterium]|nr:DegT/DnrJ/EryC1/StrS family aminotransferase [Gemmatimonadota bacterium]